MEALEASDLRLVLRAVEGLFASDDYVGLPERILDSIGMVIDLDLSSFAEVDLATGLNRFVIRPDPDELGVGTAAHLRFAQRFGNHPIVARHLAAAAPRAPNLQALCRRLRLMGTVGNCCGEAEVLLSLELGTGMQTRRLVGISINRGVREFTARDGAVFEALRPHLETAYRRSVSALMAAPQSPAAQVAPSALQLTQRESEVLFWVAMGKTNSEVGTIVGAKPLTVKKHLEHIYDKLGVPNRTAAAAAFKAQSVAP